MTLAAAVRARATLRLLVCAGALLVAAWLGVRASLPPRPLPADAPATAFSAGRAMATVHDIAMRPHPVGTPEHDRVAAKLLARLQAMGLQAEARHYLIDETAATRIARWSRGTLHPSELVDVMGVLPGRDRAAPAVLLMAHYDTVWGSPGAADDSAGVATALEVTRALAARGPRARDVVVLFTDGEELGLSGAKAFFAGDGLADHVGVAINMETRGAGGRATMFEAGAQDGALIRLFGRAADHPVGNSLAEMAYRRMPNSTDLTVAKARGLPGLNWAFTGRAALYHSPLATVDRLDPGSVQDMGRQVLGVAAALAGAAALPGPAPDAVFFDLAGHGLVHYPAAAGWLPLLAAAALLAAALRRVPVRGGDAAAGAAVGLWFLSHATLALWLFNRLSGAGAHANYYDRLAALPRLETLAVLMLAALAVPALSLRAPRRRLLGAAPGVALGLVALAAGLPGAVAWPALLVAGANGALVPRAGVGGWGGWVGLVALLLGLAVVAQVAAPLAAWVWAWPALVASAALLAAAMIGPRPATLAVAAAAAVLVTVPLLPLAHLAMLGLGADLPAILLLVASPLLAAWWPLARMRWGPAPAVATGVLLLAALLLALGVRNAPLAPSVPPYSLGT